MIATGGLLRITARRQDSLKTKAHKAHKHKKKKSKHKRRAEVVVVKAKLKLLSVSGLVAALGVLVLLVGMAMAALGYWPRGGFFFTRATPEGVASTSEGVVSMPEGMASTAGAAGTQEAEETSPAEGDGGWSPGGVNRTSQQGLGFLTDLLNRYLHSDRLKVLGPLVMGIGIFLFICANAVLHENRDKKTKVINLRDIYSTVIDLHSRHRSSISANPLSGLVNYVQSKSLEPRSRCYPAFLLSRGEGKGGAEGGGVFSVDQYKSNAASAPSPTPEHTPRLSMFALPLRPSPPPGAWRRRSARDGGQGGGREHADQGGGREDADQGGGRGDGGQGGGRGDGGQGGGQGDGEQGRGRGDGGQGGERGDRDHGGGWGDAHQGEGRGDRDQGGGQGDGGQGGGWGDGGQGRGQGDGGQGGGWGDGGQGGGQEDGGQSGGWEDKDQGDSDQCGRQGDGGQSGRRGDGLTSCPPACPCSSGTSCSVSCLHVDALLPHPSLSVSASRRCSLPAVAVATAPSQAMRIHRQSWDTAAMTSSHLWGVQQSLLLRGLPEL